MLITSVNNISSALTFKTQPSTLADGGQTTAAAATKSDPAAVVELSAAAENAKLEQQLADSPMDRLQKKTADRLEKLTDNLADIESRQQQALEKIEKHFANSGFNDETKGSVSKQAESMYEDWKKEITDKIKEISAEADAEMAELTKNAAEEAAAPPTDELTDKQPLEVLLPKPANTASAVFSSLNEK